MSGSAAWAVLFTRGCPQSQRAALTSSQSCPEGPLSEDTWLRVGYTGNRAVSSECGFRGPGQRRRWGVGGGEGPALCWPAGGRPSSGRRLSCMAGSISILCFPATPVPHSLPLLHNPPPPERTLTNTPAVCHSHCIQQILEAVLHCHQMGVVHRDLKVSPHPALCELSVCACMSCKRRPWRGRGSARSAVCVSAHKHGGVRAGACVRENARVCACMCVCTRPSGRLQAPGPREGSSLSAHVHSGCVSGLQVRHRPGRGHTGDVHADGADAKGAGVRRRPCWPLPASSPSRKPLLPLAPLWAKWFVTPQGTAWPREEQHPSTSPACRSLQSWVPVRFFSGLGGGRACHSCRESPGGT